jgi:tetrahydromethanopterin S-methyltransferase subunit F
LPAESDVRTIARFVQSVQYGMALLARDGIACAELQQVAGVAMLGFDAQVARARA